MAIIETTLSDAEKAHLTKLFWIDLSRVLRDYPTKNGIDYYKNVDFKDMSFCYVTSICDENDTLVGEGIKTKEDAFILNRDTKDDIEECYIKARDKAWADYIEREGLPYGEEQLQLMREIAECKARLKAREDERDAEDPQETIGWIKSMKNMVFTFFDGVPFIVQEIEPGVYDIGTRSCTEEVYESLKDEVPTIGHLETWYVTKEGPNLESYEGDYIRLLDGIKPEDVGYFQLNRPRLDSPDQNR